MTKVNATLARSLAECAIDKIRKKYEQEAQSKIDKLKSSPEYKELIKLKSKIHTEERTLGKKLSVIVRKTGVTMYSDLSPRRSIKNMPSINDIKTQILLASHVDGVDVKKLVDHVVSKF